VVLQRLYIFLLTGSLALFSAAGFAAEIAGAGESVEETGSAQPSFASALQESIRLRGEVDRYRERIVELELQFGPYDNRLIEPLQGLNDVLLQLQAFDEVDANLGRLLMLIRTLEGPVSRTQEPVLEDAIRNDIRRQDWESVSRRFENIYFLYSQNQSLSPNELLQARDQLIRWHQAALYLDAPARRLQHFLDARELQRQNLNLATETFGEESPLLVPWLYRSALQNYQVHAILRSEDELGFDARRAIVGGFYMDERLREVNDFILSPLPSRGPRDYLVEEQQRALRDALGEVKKIRDIVAAQGNLEAEAMAMVYEADFQSLWGSGQERRVGGQAGQRGGRVSVAARAYRDAMEKMADAGLSQQQIEAFFQRPTVIPQPQFHWRVSEALEAQDANGYLVGNGESATTHLGRFKAWSKSLPFTASPEVPEVLEASGEQFDDYEIEMSFRLNSRGQARNRKIIKSNIENARIRSDARDAVELLQFRPNFEEGSPSAKDNLRLTYEIPRYR
jgi:hypothetical protein